MSVERKLAAIMFTDIVGFTSIMRKNESTGISILENQESLIKPLVSKHKGNIVKKTGDGYLLEFSSSVEAVQCAIAMQESIKGYNSNEENLEFHIRIGIHLGDILIMGNDILGDGVNIASRIEPLASPGGICLTEAVYESIKSKINISPRRISNVDLKHIDDKYTIYKLPNDDDVLDEKETDGHLSKIKIINEKYDNDFFKSMLTQYKYSLFPTFLNIILYQIVYNLTASLPITDFSKYSEPYYALIFFPLFLGFSLIFTTIISIPIMKRTIQITFEDIRDVENLIQILITNMGYSFVSKKNGKIEYSQYNKKQRESIWRVLGKPLGLTTKAMKDMDLTMYINGNTLVLQGMYMHTKKLSKTFRQHIIIN